MNWKYGYNYDTGSVPLQKFLLEASNSGSNVHLVMCAPQNGIATIGDLNLLWDIYNYLRPVVGEDLVLIWRWFSDREGEYSIYPDSKIYQAVLQGVINARGLPPNTIVDSFFNEPNLGGNSYLTNEKYVRRELQMLRDMKAIGVKYAVGAFSTGTPNEEMIDRGVYDDLIREADYWSLHLYGVFPFEAGETYPYDLMLKNEDNKQTIRSIYLDGHKFPDNYNGWLFGRVGWWEKRARAIGVDFNNKNVYITELFLDIIGSAPNWVRSQWKNDFGIDIYQRDPRGILTWFNHFKWVFPELTIEEILELIMNHLRDNVLNKKYIKGGTLFGYNRNWDYPHGKHKESGHNWENSALDGFRQHTLKRINSKVTIPNEPSQNEYGIIWSNGTSNIRQLPKLGDENRAKDDDGNYLVLTENPMSIIMLDSDLRVNDNTYSWYKFIAPNTQIYYVAKTNRVQYQKQEPPTDEPAYIVDLLGMTQVFKSSELQDLTELMVEFRDFISEIKEESETNDYVISLLSSLVELVDEADDGNMELTLVFLDRIIEGLKEAQTF